MFGVSNTVPDRPKWLIWTGRMITLHLWRMREEPNKKRAREHILEYASREPIDDASMHNGVKRWISCSYATGEWKFEHFEAFQHYVNPAVSQLGGVQHSFQSIGLRFSAETPTAIPNRICYTLQK